MDDYRLEINMKYETAATGFTEVKRQEVFTDKLVIFYLSKVCSILLYCDPAFYTMLISKQKELLKYFQKQYTKTLLHLFLRSTDIAYHKLFFNGYLFKIFISSRQALCYVIITTT